MPSLAARARDRPCFQTTRFSEFWQSAIPANEDKKQMPKLSARVNKMLIGVQVEHTRQGQTSIVFYDLPIMKRIRMPDGKTFIPSHPRILDKSALSVIVERNSAIFKKHLTRIHTVVK